MYKEVKGDEISVAFSVNSRFKIVFMLATGYHNSANYKKTHE